MAQQCSDQQLLETRLLDCTVTAGPGSCRYQVFFLIFLGHNILKVCIICVGFGSDEAWLWKRYAGRNSVVSTGLPAGGHECGSSTCRYDHITALLHRLHCFHVSQRISFKLPSWFTSASVDLVPPIWTTPVARIPGRQRNRRRRHWMSVYATVHCWRQTVSRRRGTNMEQFASWSDVIKFPAILRDRTKITFILGVVPIVSKLL